MTGLTVLCGESTDLIVKYVKGKQQNTYRLVESPQGDIVFIVNGELRVYLLNPTSKDELYRYHQFMMKLEWGLYNSTGIKFICRGLREAVVKHHWDNKTRTINLAVVVDDLCLAHANPAITADKSINTNLIAKSFLIAISDIIENARWKP